MKNEKIRVQVMMSKELVDKIDNYSRYMGTSRSSLCAMIISQGILGYDKAIDILGEQIASKMEINDTRNN